MIFRSARAQDAASIISWFRTRADVVRWAGPEAPDPLNAAWLTGEFAAVDRSYFVLAEPRDAPAIGVLGLRWFMRERRAHLMRVGLAPRVRGYGVSRTLLKGAEAKARAAGAERLTLTVWRDNDPARRAYEAAGYFTCGVDPRVVRMLKPLGPVAGSAH